MTAPARIGLFALAVAVCLGLGALAGWAAPPLRAGDGGHHAAAPAISGVGLASAPWRAPTDDPARR